MFFGEKCDAKVGARSEFTKVVPEYLTVGVLGSTESNVGTCHKEMGASLKSSY